MKRIILFVLFLNFSCVSFAQINYLRNEDVGHHSYGSPNVVASRLVGTWKVNPELTKKLGDRVMSKEALEEKIVFKEDSTLINLIAESVKKNIKQELNVYLAGHIIGKNPKNASENISIPFLIIAGEEGNTYLMTFRERDGDKYGDAEFNIIFIAVSGSPKNDLLFMGGDFNNQPFMCLERVE